MGLRLHEAVLNAGVDAIVDRVDQGSGVAGEIQFWSGPVPGTVDGAPSGELLVTVSYQNPAFGGASNATATAIGVPLESTGINDGNIGFARVLDTDGNVLWDDDNVGTDSSNSITVNTTTVSDGVDFEVTSHTFGIDDDTAS